ncbi:protein ANTI-SILENCING 1-like isoform X2 [Lycium barbarum]|uniref:protein ANTI-SILENCING 1-like isoform X2 n=1 Tax=Lycium barbarum TaxID=112863 RepID=UPI00293E2227|nr:protein ANTI-SILENCING 1-like isoform X2 [Lycium barbarum]
MFPLQEEEEDSPKFCWGAKKGKGAHNKGVQFYMSFTYDGVEFNLYDCVYMCRHGETEPDIGKIVKVWETAEQKRIVKVVWFFRPTEVTHWLGHIKVLPNELLLASGEGIGLSNRNPVEAITGKCNVVCTSTDRRNPRPKDEDLGTADFFFYRTFDVGTRQISEKFPNSIAQIEVEHFFNKVKDQKQPLHYGGKGSLEKPHASLSFGGATTKTALKDGQPGRNTQSMLPPGTLVKQNKSSTNDVAMVRMEQSSMNTCAVDKELKKTNGTSARNEVKYSYCTSPTSLSDSHALKKRKLLDSSGTALFEQHNVMHSKGQVTEVVEKGGRGRQGNISETDKTVARTEKHSYCTSSTNSSDSHALKKRKLQDSLGTASSDQRKVMKSTSQVIEVTTRVKEGASTWFKEQPWNERLQAAQERGTLVLLENLDPSYVSAEVVDIVWHALEQKVSAKMLQHNTFSNPLNGKAFVIFRSSEAAENAMFELKRRCLMLGDGRPVVARRGIIEEPGKSRDFPGHLSIGKIKFQKLGEEMRKAVSTSHYSQSNTIENEMAIDWRVLQEESSLRWKALHQEQAAEIERLSSKLKTLI